MLFTEIPALGNDHAIGPPISITVINGDSEISLPDLKKDDEKVAGRKTSAEIADLMTTEMGINLPKLLSGGDIDWPDRSSTSW